MRKQQEKSVAAVVLESGPTQRTRGLYVMLGVIGLILLLLIVHHLSGGGPRHH